ncbi:hypothetical protein C8F04DRAFT_1184664 [Mycena alexandri]|uniref:Uncharacterized protein n=1 Tax=Mycena alexandri TaxID=1745969 RepID=A0AAD6SRG8_9AGAR|nr:hypothetical protein C8F04DRAFT_1184664 [Mycena alexandri]
MHSGCTGSIHEGDTHSRCAGSMGEVDARGVWVRLMRERGGCPRRMREVACVRSERLRWRLEVDVRGVQRVRELDVCGRWMCASYARGECPQHLCEVDAHGVCTRSTLARPPRRTPEVDGRGRPLSVSAKPMLTLYVRGWWARRGRTLDPLGACARSRREVDPCGVCVQRICEVDACGVTRSMGAPAPGCAQRKGEGIRTGGGHAISRNTRGRVRGMWAWSVRMGDASVEASARVDVRGGRGRGGPTRRTCARRTHEAAVHGVCARGAVREAQRGVCARGMCAADARRAVRGGRTRRMCAADTRGGRARRMREGAVRGRAAGSVRGGQCDGTWGLYAGLRTRRTCAAYGEGAVRGGAAGTWRVDVRGGHTRRMLRGGRVRRRREGDVRGVGVGVDVGGVARRMRKEDGGMCVAQVRGGRVRHAKGGVCGVRARWIDTAGGWARLVCEAGGCAGFRGADGTLLQQSDRGAGERTQNGPV